MGLGVSLPALKRRSVTRASRVAVAVVMAVGLAMTGACGGSNGSGGGDDSITVGVLLPGGGASRFGQFDKPLMEKHLKRVCPDCPAAAVAATGEPAVQRQQLEAMITRGVDVLIVSAVDPEALRSSVESANQAGIPVVAYDRLAQGPISGYVTFDGATVGRLQGEALLKAMGAKASSSQIVMMNGATIDPNAGWFKRGALSVLQGKVKIGKSYDTVGWRPENAVIIAVMGGAAAGGFQGFVFTKIRVPAFVVTLAGLLAWNGLMLYLLGPEGSISFSEDGLVSKLTSRYFDAVVFTYGLAALGTAAYFLISYGDRRRRGAAGMPCRSVGEIWARTALLAVVAFAAVYVLGRFEGLPLALLIFIGAIVASDLFLRRTPYGRQVLALGGGVEAARRSGVHVARVRIWVFLVSGTLAAVGGLFVASRLSSATTVPGSGSLLINAIAAAVIGGTSLFGGRGSTWSALLGVLIIQSIASGMALLGVEPAVQFMITGGVLLTAVVFDSLARRAAASRGRA
ncbi:hypothetical protein SALBM311S_04131 [Streptomyces alboniger]